MDSSPSTRHPVPDPDLPELSPEARETYGWQLDVEGFGEAGQRRLQAASVLVSRVGGLGGNVALQLAAAGVGHLILAHGGNLTPSDLNRQVLMSHAGLGRPRMPAAVERLKALNPRLRITAMAEQVSERTVRDLVAAADLVVDCAPRFEERYLLNRESVAQRRPMVECAVYGLELHLTTLVPGKTPCLRCLYPELSSTWTRRFPVFGAVAAVAGGLAAMEAIKQLSGLGNALHGRLLTLDLRTHRMATVRIRRVPGCIDCGAL